MLKKNLEIVKLQDAQKGKESRSALTEFSTESSSCRSSSSPSPERKKVQMSLTGLNFNMEKTLETNDVDQKKEIEDLKSKLKAVSICVDPLLKILQNMLLALRFRGERETSVRSENEMRLSCELAVLR